MAHDHKKSYDIGKHGARIGIDINIALFIFELFAGIVGKSSAMVADSLHVLSDVLASVVVFVGFRIAQKPADKDHPYGHGRAESIAAKLVSLVLLIAGAKVAYDAIRLVISQHFHVPGMIALWAAVISILLKEWMFRYTYSLGVKINSSSLKADSWHHRSDSISSIAALIGIGGARLGFTVLDPIAAFVVSLFIIKIGVDFFRVAYNELMDTALPDDMIGDIRRLSMQVAGVDNVRDIKGRKMGIDIHVDLTIEVDENMTVGKSHAITDEIRRNILKDLAGAKEIFVHVEPFAGK